MVLFLFAGLAVALAVWWIASAYVRAAPGRPKAAPVLIACGIGAASALGLYLFIGKPFQADEPFKTRLADIRKRDPNTMNGPEMLAVLAAEARQHPEDARPHLFTGQILAEEGRDADAARAFEAALRRDPKSAPALLGLGRVLVRLQEGAVTEDALALFQEAAKQAPDDPAPWLYQGLAATQQGRNDEALKLWPEVLKRLGPDDPRRAMAEAMIAEAKKPKVTQPAAEAPPGGVKSPP